MRHETSLLPFSQMAVAVDEQKRRSGSPLPAVRQETGRVLSMKPRIEIKPERRTLDQNALLWSRLHQISESVVWHGLKLADTEWKDVFTAALKRQKVVPGLDGGFVVLGTSTRRMTKTEMTELLDLVEAFGVEHNVRFKSQERAA